MTKKTLFFRVAGLIALLILFFVSIELLGASFKLMGSNVAESLLRTTANPFVGLFIGILATSLVQSSSTVTSMVVGIVAGGGLTVAGAIPIVLGANIGTSVTNTIVSLGHISRKDEFARAMGAATVHDFFNILAVLVFFPLELATGFLTKGSALMTQALSNVGGMHLLDPVSLVTDPLAAGVVSVMQGNGVLVLITGVLALFASLRFLVMLLRSLLLGRTERLINKYLFGPIPIALAFGTLVTIMVQSSSITTSVTVPLVAAGLITVRQVFPFVLGANIGTTVTALLAALVVSSPGNEAAVTALQVAFAHLIFNVGGVLVVIPFRRLRAFPVWLANNLGRLAVRNRSYAIAYILLIFFLLPLIVIFLTGPNRESSVDANLPSQQVHETRTEIPNGGS